MTKKLLLAMGGALLLTGCGSTGPIPPFGHTLTQDWIQADFDGQQGSESISRTNLADIVFNNKGEIIGWYVKNYAGSPYIKENRDGTFDFTALQNERGITNLVNGPALAIQAEGLDADAPVQAQEPQLTNNEETNEQVAVFRYEQGGVPITKTVTIHTRNYLINVQTEVGGDVGEYQMVLPGLANEGNPRVRALPTVGESATVQGAGVTSVENIRYAAMQHVPPNQMSPALLLRPAGDTQIDVNMTGGSNAQLALGLSGNSSVDVYGGRNELIHLTQTGFAQMPGVFDPNWFGHISLGLVSIMEFLHRLVGDWGIVILLIAVLVRLVMWPLMQSQARTAAKMQILQPKMKEIQDRYKDQKDRESQMQMQMEMAALYKENNFNPAGCFSMFLPMPVLIALWSTIRNFEFDSGFLWMPDLAIPDPLWILPVLYLVTNMAQLWMSTRKTPEMFRQQAIIYLFFVYFALIFPAGVSIYLIISTAIGVLQQFIVNKQVEAEAAHAAQTVQKTVPSGSTKRKSTKVIDAPKD
ncbi:YidC/Oxa1 family membrane protein insertase [Deinococcus radiophilus]|uniref:Membrane protein insertase YidC n=1 Tax=Deinococcus radiophilus TaxID=32062 RepID=A0A431VVA7_9DEIO|nr:membrane protein insertase YidC [Deinococcus radiophilus]RTR27075.1 membrane protein insertase YidC [Deinococcus radiophilus]UFA50142.1 membrane protein insertase YidC [Deinococcus radiophilus]